MASESENRLTGSSPSGSHATVGGNGQLGKWSKRYNWATCEEPYRTEFDSLASLWLEGALSSEALAMEIVRLLSELEWGDPTGSNSPAIDVGKEMTHVKILAEALLSSEIQVDSTPQERRQILDRIRIELGQTEAVRKPSNEL